MKNPMKKLVRIASWELVVEEGDDIHVVTYPYGRVYEGIVVGINYDEDGVVNYTLQPDHREQVTVTLNGLSIDTISYVVNAGE